MSSRAKKSPHDVAGLAVPGFRFGAAACGIKAAKGALDCALVVADEPVPAAGVFTRNGFAAAPVRVARERTRSGRLQAIVVNSGNANACTGEAGLKAARTMCEAAGTALGVSARYVAPASTGVIGVPLPMDRLAPGIAMAAKDADASRLERFARAITTTDAYLKVASERVMLGGKKASVVAIAKGAGMIAPDMATLLVFVLTDARITSPLARELAQRAAAPLNELSVDGDTSTNDSLFVLASGRAENREATPGGTAARALGDAAEALGLEIARLVAADGEGATHVVAIDVEGGRSHAEARQVARVVANSPLVRAAFHGADPNWGRIVCAVGRSGVAVDPDRVSVRIGSVEVFAAGRGFSERAQAARAEMTRPEFKVRIDLKRGRHAARVLTCDLTPAYVTFNSAYTS